MGVEIKFSVVIPVYNSEQTIARALESVIHQSYPPFEVIVVDDASTDSTADIVQNQYPQAKYIKKITNSGSSATRNVGIDAAKGDYIAFLDSDDVWHKDKLMLANTIIESTQGINLFYHPFTQEDISKKQLPENITVYKLPFVKLLAGNVIATSCAIIRNDPQFRFESSMRYTEDYDLWLRIGYKHNIHFTNIPLTQIFRPFLSKGGISESKWKMRKGEMKAYRRLTKLNPLFIFLLPFLLVSSLGKHVVKMVAK
jgi:glycosyltransferase involved in cell wall biosynthesis